MGRKTARSTEIQLLTDALNEWYEYQHTANEIHRSVDEALANKEHALETDSETDSGTDLEMDSETDSSDDGWSASNSEPQAITLLKHRLWRTTRLRYSRQRIHYRNKERAKFDEVKAYTPKEYLTTFRMTKQSVDAILEAIRYNARLKSSFGWLFVTSVPHTMAKSSHRPISESEKEQSLSTPSESSLLFLPFKISTFKCQSQERRNIKPRST
jgi:hypothetical protein